MKISPLKCLSPAMVCGSLVMIASAALAHDTIPLGDGNISAAPQRGYLFSCQQSFNPNAPGAVKSGSWIKGGTWSPSGKPDVDGKIGWPGSRIDISLKGGARIISANNLPDHPTGSFPVARSDDAYQFDRNPNTIREQRILLRLPAVPAVAAEPSCVPMGMIGFALSGAAIFNAVDAKGQDAPAHEIQDACNGHPERNGQYHYHNLSPCLPDKGREEQRHSDLVGYALDGFGIFGINGVGGQPLHNADLDACHGHVHEVSWNGETRNIYHYHYTDEYPYAVGCFMGTPAKLENARGASGEQGAQPANGRAILRRAAQILGVSERQLADAVGAPPPDFRKASRVLGISQGTIKAAFDTARGQ
ncbi:MAG: YHYH protein [Nitratireductor sp.]